MFYSLLGVEEWVWFTVSLQGPVSLSTLLFMDIFIRLQRKVESHQMILAKSQIVAWLVTGVRSKLRCKAFPYSLGLVAWIGRSHAGGKAAATSPTKQVGEIGLGMGGAMGLPPLLTLCQLVQLYQHTRAECYIKDRRGTG